MLEKQIEDAVCRYARDKGVLAYKFTSPSRRAVPDRMFIAPGGVVWFAEFKQTGKKPTAPQEREHARLRDQGCVVLVIDTVDGGKMMIDMMVGGA